MILKLHMLVLLLSFSLYAQATHAGRNVFRPGAIKITGSHIDVAVDIGTGNGDGSGDTSTEGRFFHIGGMEFGTEVYRTIGFGHLPPGNTHAPAYIGYIEKVDTGQTSGSIIIGTRNSTSDIEASVRVTVESSGDVGIGVLDPQEILDIGNAVPAIRVRDTSATSAVQTTGHLEFGQDIGGVWTRHMVLGYGSSSHDDIVLNNNSSGGHFRITLGGTGGMRVGSGSVPNHKLHVDGAIQMEDEGTKPTCVVGERFTIWVDAGAASVKDTVEVCAKAADDSYAWRALY